ncbi:MAG: hypothetical protein K2X81_22460, partial [Candidatus Obscuribacterales bacterium]|nr:hypothetical protein [Candidatus Obscuribacterales bacterium]
AFLSLLLVILAASTLGIGFLLAQRNQIAHKEATKSTHEKVLPRSVLGQLHNISVDYFKLINTDEDGTDRKLRAQLNLLIRLSNLIDSIDRNDKAMLYAAWSLKSEMQWKLKLGKQLEETIKKTLTYCTTNDGSYKLKRQMYFYA